MKTELGLVGPIFLGQMTNLVIYFILKKNIFVIYFSKFIQNSHSVHQKLTSSMIFKYKWLKIITKQKIRNPHLEQALHKIHKP